MLSIDVRTKNNNFTEVTLYNSWDLPEDATIITDWLLLDKFTEKGSYIKFDDGSELYAEIIKVSGSKVVTTAGRFKIADLIHCSRPKDSKAGYNGVEGKDRSFFVAPLRDKEKDDILSFFKGELKSFRSPRVNKVIQDMMQQELAKTGYTAKESVELMVDEVRQEKRGQHWGYCHKGLSIIMGFDTTKLPEQASDGADQLNGGDVLDFLETTDDAELILEKNISKEKHVPSGKAMRSLNSAIGKISPDTAIDILEDF